MNFINKGFRKKPNLNQQTNNPKTIGDITDKGFVVNFSKLDQKIKECQRNKEDQKCKEMLKDLGIEFSD